MFIVFDTETTGLPKNFSAPITDSDNWPRLVEIAWQIHGEDGALIDHKRFIIKPEGYTIPYGASKIHHITTEMALEQGVALREVLTLFDTDLKRIEFLVGHNTKFDINIVGAEFYRMGYESLLSKLKVLDTMGPSTQYCQLSGGRGGGFKMPTLTELHRHLFQETFGDAHSALADVEATARCFFELVRLQVISWKDLGFSYEQQEKFLKNNRSVVLPAGTTLREVKQQEAEDEKIDIAITDHVKDMGEIEHPYSHLHVHSYYSILEGAASIEDLVRKATSDHMPAIALTDHGNMYGIKAFHSAVSNYNSSLKRAKEASLEDMDKEIEQITSAIAVMEKGKEKDELEKNLKTKKDIRKETIRLKSLDPLKAIIGCEVYIAARSMFQKEGKIDSKSTRLVLLAKDYRGYENLMLLTSRAYTEGMYYYPRIDRQLLAECSEGLIALSSSLAGDIPMTWMNHGEEKAKELIKEYIDIFGENFYLELQRHPSKDKRKDHVITDQQNVNQFLCNVSREFGVKVIAANGVRYINENDAAAHDRLLCISTGKNIDDENRRRFTGQEWFKTQEEMKTLFSDIPEAIENIQEVVDKISEYELHRDPIMPEFPLPEGFDDPNEYLRHITYEGAKKRWGEELSDDLKERLDFELATVKKMGFPGYFLIVWDFLNAARELDVWIGPGRGSAAGSAVAYCLRITEIDPIKYGLLFERFLNPDRISMPDIDIDFDDDGRSRIMKWVVDKYGEKRVAQIITFGTMAAKSAIRDVARVQQLPLDESNRLAKMVPEKPGMTLAKAYEANQTLQDELYRGTPEVKSVLENAQKLEGTVRNIGKHACGVIIGADDLHKYIPITVATDSELKYLTQYESKYVEDVGLLKMDFLGLKTLSIMKEAVEIIKRSRGIDVDIHNLKLDDKKTYELFSRGETSGIFQFESEGMKKSLRELKPTRFEDLIAMTALYRPGPMDYIPMFIRRKHGIESIQYDLPEMEEYLEETYGVTVYQEQVMLLSKKLANFTGGQSDSLRKAMGKKDLKLMEKLKGLFIQGCREKGVEESIVHKIWDDWVAFASYAFNKSHATCYSYVSYQTAYLKANFPAEFMAAVLSRNMSAIDKVTFFIDECNNMGIKVLFPDINESFAKFTVNAKGEIRFGLTAIKGVGTATVESIITERDKGGAYRNMVDFLMRCNYKTTNRRNIEAMVLAGVFDCFQEVHRAQFFDLSGGELFLDKLVKFGHKLQIEKQSQQLSIFSEMTDDTAPTITFPDVEPWGEMERLQKEKEVVGFYLSSHPLKDYDFEIENFCNATLKMLDNSLSSLNGITCYVAGIVSVPSPVNLVTKKNKPYGRFTIEDYSGSKEFYVYDEVYSKCKALIENNATPLMLKISVRKKPYQQNGEDVFAAYVNEVLFLDDFVPKKAKKMTIYLDAESLDENLVMDLHGIAVANPGSGSLYLKVSDQATNMALEFESLSCSINIKGMALGLKRSMPLRYAIS